MGFLLKRTTADERFVDSCVEEDELQGYDPRGLRSDVDTRWSSLCLLFESAAASHEVLNDVLVKTKSYELLLDASEVDEICVVAKIYRVSCVNTLEFSASNSDFQTPSRFQSISSLRFPQVILDMMVLVQGSKRPTINMVVLATIDIESTLGNTESWLTSESESACEFGAEVAQELLLCVQKRMRPFSAMELLGAVLDPEMKSILQIRAEPPGENVSKFLLDSIHEYVPETVPETLDQEDSAIVVEQPSKKKRSSLIAKYASAIAPTESLSNEIDRYLALQVKFAENVGSKHEDNTLKWWRQNSPAFPSIAKLARTILSIPATSAEAERRFSAAGNVLRVKRCSMDPLTMTKTLFIHDNKDVLTMHD